VDDQREPEAGQEPGQEEHRGESERDEPDRRRDESDSAEGGDEPGHKIRQAEPEEKAEKETTEDIDRAFD
jgi:hypothetical protein